MKNKCIILVIFSIIMGCRAEENVPHRTGKGNEGSKKMVIHIILGSTRQGRTSHTIAQVLKNKADTRNDIVTEVLDLRDYNLPFLNDETAPASREKITDPTVKKWSDKIKEADAYIIIVPEYNAGYPGVLKNALDSLYKEWNNKPVALIGYSGGPSGGASALAQLRQVVSTLKMTPISFDITIPYSGKAFSKHGDLKTIEQEISTLLDRLVDAQKRVYKS